MAKKQKRVNSRATRSRGRKKKSIFKSIFILILLIAIIALGIFTYKVYQNGWGLSGIISTVIGHDSETVKDLKEFKVLLLGISTDQEDVYLTDTIMVASYNPNTQKASLLSIPRDTYTGSNVSTAVAYDKLNSFYARNNRPDETLAAVNKVTGLDIEYYIVVKTEALIEIVDAIGGVTFNVPIRMKYTDTSQDLFIDLQAGEQLLNGEQAEQLLRFRQNDDYTTYPEEYGDNDTGRMRTQREFITAVIEQTLRPENILKIGELLEIANENIITNIDLNFAKDYIPYAVEFDVANLQAEVLPGTNLSPDKTGGTWIFYPNKAQVEDLIEEMFITRDLVPEEVEDGQVSKENLVIEILDGSGSSTALQEVVTGLKEAGFNVSRQGTTNLTSRSTIYSDDKVNSTTLTNIKNILGISTTDMLETTTSSTVNIKIVLGKDYI